MIENVVNENNEQLNIEIVLSFNVEEYNKSYVAYTVNDDHVSDTVQILISEFEEIDGKPHIKPIPDDEVKTVVGFYNYLRNSINDEESGIETN